MKDISEDFTVMDVLCVFCQEEHFEIINSNQPTEVDGKATVSDSWIRVAFVILIICNLPIFSATKCGCLL